MFWNTIASSKSVLSTVNVSLVADESCRKCSSRLFIQDSVEIDAEIAVPLPDQSVPLPDQSVSLPDQSVPLPDQSVNNTIIQPVVVEKTSVQIQTEISFGPRYYQSFKLSYSFNQHLIFGSHIRDILIT